ncbi:MAG: hypothetical protein V3R16_07585 [Nitrospirales bacterium]
MVSLTKLAYTAILEDLDRMIGLTVDPTRTHYAVLAGILIHGAEHRDYVWPGAMYAMVAEKRQTLSLA